MIPSPYYHVGKVSYNNPFSTFGTTWCPRCKQEVEADTDSEYSSNTFVIRQRCNRCGRVIAQGYYCNVPLLSSSPLPAMALEWIREPGRDRR